MVLWTARVGKTYAKGGRWRGGSRSRRRLTSICPSAVRVVEVNEALRADPSLVAATHKAWAGSSGSKLANALRWMRCWMRARTSVAA